MSAQLPSPYPNGAPTQVVAPNGSFPTRQDPSFAELPAQREARTQLFVGNLPFRVRWQDLKDLMRKCGTVLRVDVALTPEGRSRGFGVVLFGRIEDAQKAIELYNGYSWQTRILDVRLDSEEGTVINPSSTLDQSHLDHLAPSSASPSPNIMPRTIPGFEQPSGRPRISPPLVPSPLVAPPQTVSPAPIPGPPPQSTHEAPPRDYWYPQQHQQSFGPPPMHMQMQMQMPPQMMPPHMGMMPMQGFAPFAASHGYPPAHGMMPNYPPQGNQRGGPQRIDPAHMNRHVFVGNLPFNCQWQELKDLMRSAGAVLRADIAQGSDGRSRGFGSILFSSPQDADRAVQMFNGYDYNGRALKVHFDKFSQTTTGPAAAPLYMPYPGPDPSFHNNSYNAPPQDRQYQSWGLTRGPESEFPLSSDSEGVRTNVSSTGHFQDRSGESSATSEGQDVEETRESKEAMPARPPYRSIPSMRIGMPPPYPFAGPTSPMTGRMPPMTPSMPAFTLGAFPQTPPLYPQFFSPGLGLGAFSPPMVGAHYTHGHYNNAAPGAPIHHNPMFPLSPTQADHHAMPSLSEPSYFPAVPISSDPSVLATIASSPLDESTDDTSPASVAPVHVLSEGLSSLALDVPIVSNGSSSTLSADSSSGRTPTNELAPPGPISNGGRRKSFVSSATTGGEERATAFAVRKKFEGQGGGRRNSFEDKRGGTKPVFGASSIWAE